MKHSFKITLVLIAIFLVSQLFGLFILSKNMNIERDEVTGQMLNVTYKDTGYVKDAEIDNRETMTFVAAIVIGVLIGTGIVLLLAKFKKHNIWRYWFSLVVIIGLYKAFSVFVNPWIALALAVVLSVWKAFRPNPIIQNLTELFMYAGLAIIFVQLMNIYAAVLLLLIISVYDMIAVWKSKHMITLAKFQIKTKAFAGLSIPYELGKKAPSPAKAHDKKSVKKEAAKGAAAKVREVKSAILGGGDMAFPLFFSGMILESYGLFNAIIVSLITTAALFGLLMLGKKDRFYPAMPFISLGCFVGWGLVVVITAVF